MPHNDFEGGIFHVRAYAFFLSDSENGKNGAFQKKRRQKSGTFREKARDRFENEKRT